MMPDPQSRALRLRLTAHVLAGCARARAAGAAGPARGPSSPHRRLPAVPGTVVPVERAPTGRRRVAADSLSLVPLRLVKLRVTVTVGLTAPASLSDPALAGSAMP